MIQSCFSVVSQRRALVCGKCWLGVANMCRGKRRQTETTARIIQLRRPEKRAYDCKVCSTWHNGRVNEGVDIDRLRAEVAHIMQVLERTRGREWVETLIARWDPASGGYSRFDDLVA